MKRRMNPLKKIDDKFLEGISEVQIEPFFGITLEKYKYEEYDLAKVIANSDVTLLGFNSEKSGKLRHRILFVDGRDMEKKYFRLTNKQFDYLKQELKHRRQRVANGVSFRDAWNVDHWVATTCAEVLNHLEEDTHGFPPCAVELHKRVVEEVEGKKYKCEEKYKDMNGDDHAWNVYKDDLKRMVFLFREYSEETCSIKNPYEFRLHWDFLDDPEHKDCRRIEFYGTDAEKKETENYNKKQNEIDLYRAECLHKALKMLNIYIEYLWD